MVRRLLFFLLIGAFLYGISDEEKAELYEQQGEFQEALDLYKALYKEAPTNMEFLYNIGRLYGVLQEWPAAESALKGCLERNPHDVDALVMLSYIYYWQRRYREAIEEAEYALKEHPHNVDALLAAGSAYRLGGDIQIAERYFEKALQLHPERCDAHLLMGGLMHAERRYQRAYEEYLCCFKHRPSEWFAEKGVITTKPLVHPGVEVRSLYVQEREQDLLVPITTTQMTTLNNGLEVTYPINDRFMPYAGVVYDLQVQYNLVVKTNNYRVNSYFQNIGSVFRFGDLWSLDVESKVHFARNKGDSNLLPFQNVTKWEPRATLQYLGNEHFFVSGAVKDSLIARLFSISESVLIPKKGLFTAYEYRFKVPYNGVGVQGNMGWYGGSIPNRDQEYSVWLRFRIPSAVPDLLIRYEFAYRGFKDVVGAYNSFKWRNQHLGKITYHKEWVPRAYLDLSYSFLWSNTHQLTDQSGIVLPGGITDVPVPIQKNIFRANILEGLIHYIKRESLHFEGAGRYYQDTNRYRAWSFLISAQMIF
jgi:hypothetical protein